MTKAEERKNEMINREFIKSAKGYIKRHGMLNKGKGDEVTKGLIKMLDRENLKRLKEVQK